MAQLPTVSKPFSGPRSDTAAGRRRALPPAVFTAASQAAGSERIAVATLK